MTEEAKKPAGPVTVQCQHYICRCGRAAELAAMGRTVEAIAAHQQIVTCRMPGQHPAPVQPTVPDEEAS